jgi:UDP:flavonoid glycosyltransferase YjiC (YdhE family)
MVAIPVGFDQPGVAARLAYHGAGEFVEVPQLTADRLSELIRKVKENPSYREKARYFQKAIARTRGLDVAADVIERAVGASLTDERVEFSRAPDMLASESPAPATRAH